MLTQRGMRVQSDFEIFLVSAPGLEGVLCDEVRALGLREPVAVPGGVVTTAGWQAVMRANLTVRGASRVLARIGSFPAVHLSQLDKRARKLDWRRFLRADVQVRVEASCKKSKIYHSGAAAERVGKAIAAAGVPISAGAELRVLVRIDNDVVTVSVDTSGEALHKRGHKQAVNKAPLRETLAALFLRQCGFSGDETVFDPMCGSGTFVIEAAEIAAGLKPGRSRDFAFQQLSGFDREAWAKLRVAGRAGATQLQFFGRDRDAGAVRMAARNAERAGVGKLCAFEQRAIADVQPPAGGPGLVMLNPPYGGRLGDRKALLPLYRSIGQVLQARFSGWRVGMVTSAPELAGATGLPFGPPPEPVDNGGIRVRCYSTAVLDEV